MNHAERCPVCQGLGGVRTHENLYSTHAQYEKPCHGCGGRGWVVIEDAPSEVKR